MTASDPSSTSLTASPAQTLEALEASAVVRWWQTTGFLEVAGPDAASFLDGLCTQAVERVEPGHAVLGLFLDAKAKIIAPVVLHRTADEPWTDPRGREGAEPTPPTVRLLLETLPELVEPLRAHLARYRLRAKVTLEPIELASIAVTGAALPDELPPLDGAWTIVAEQARPTRAFLGSQDDCAELVRTLLPSLGLSLADPDTLEADRIEHGVPGLHDLLPGRMPAEVGGMDRAVALDAGCYLGQEPVARLHYRGHANRTLRRLASTDAPTPAASDAEAPDAHLELRDPAAGADSRALGRLTTWATGADGRTLALAVLRREVTPEQALVLAGDEATFHALDDAP